MKFVCLAIRLYINCKNYNFIIILKLLELLNMETCEYQLVKYAILILYASNL